MTNIFAEKYQLYPPEKEPVLKYYKEYFDNVFIALIPFSKISNEKIREFKNAKIVDNKIEEIKSRIQDVNRLKNYPYLEESFSDIEEYYFTEKVNWNEILNNSEFKNIKELNKALMTSIKALKKELEEPEKAKKLENFCETNSIIQPSEGFFDVLSKIGIYNCLVENNLFEIKIIKEFHEYEKKLNIKDISDLEFVNKIDFKDYYIFSKDKEILFTIDWDYFFFFICINSKKVTKDTIEKNFHGFWASAEDSHLWTWEKGEIEQKLNLK